MHALWDVAGCLLHTNPARRPTSAEVASWVADITSRASGMAWDGDQEDSDGETPPRRHSSRDGAEGAGGGLLPIS